MTHQLIQDFENKHKSKVKCDFNIGDTIRVHIKIIEGEKERIQVFTGIVISFKGKGLSKTITLYRNAYGCSMERVFLLSSPRITKIQVEKRGKVKKAKLYHIRGESGKKAKVRERFLGKTEEKTAEEKEKPSMEVKITESIEEKPIEQAKVEEEQTQAKKKEKEKEKKKTSDKKEKKEE